MDNMNDFVIENGELKKINGKISDVMIPDGVISIGKSAFRNRKGITSITIPKSVTSIGNNAFSGCTNLSAITIPESITTIGDYAFSDCTNLSAITIPESVTTIGEGVFEKCTNLTGFVIPDSVTSIGERAFYGCKSLVSLSIPNSVTQIGNHAFFACTGLTSISIPETISMIDNSVFGCCRQLTDITIPESVTCIGSGAFGDCDRLTEITVPDNVTVIGFNAFSDCKNLKTVRLPVGLQKIEGKAFAKCVSLEKIDLPEGITQIGDMAFNGCRLLTEIVVPDHVSELKSGTFAGCKALKSVTLPADLTVIGNACFGACGKLETIEIPSTVKAIEDRAFSSCTALKEVTLPDELETIGEESFANCNKKLRLYCSGAIFGMFGKETKDNLTKLWLSGETEFSKDQTNAIKKYAARAKVRLFTEIEGDDESSITRLLECGKVTPEMLTSFIQKCNDGQHPKMMAVLLDYQNKTVSPEQKEEIADKAIGLAEMTVQDWKKIYRWTEEPEGVVISKYKGIDAEVKIPDQIGGKPVIKIGKNAFKGNTQVQRIVMPITVTEILESAFEKCEALTEIKWGESLRIIEKRAFYHCKLLSGTLDLPQSVRSIGVNAFSGCNYTDINLQEGLEFIADGALDCENYTQLHIPNSVKKIGFCTSYYFSGDLYIHGKKTKFNPNDFFGMPITVHAPAGSYAAKCADNGVFKKFQVM